MLFRAGKPLQKLDSLRIVESDIFKLFLIGSKHFYRILFKEPVQISQGLFKVFENVSFFKCRLDPLYKFVLLKILVLTLAAVSPELLKHFVIFLKNRDHYQCYINYRTRPIISKKLSCLASTTQHLFAPTAEFYSAS